PAGATRATLKKRQSGVYCVEYRMAAPAVSKQSDSEPTFEVKPRRDLMPALHQLYGDPTWLTYYLARTTFEDVTSEPLREVRLRARLRTSKGVAKWTNWDNVAAVVHPGQVVQFPLYATFEEKVWMIDSAEKAELDFELSYTGADRQDHKITRRARVHVLGK